MLRCEEKELRKESVQWLSRKYQKYDFHLPIMEFHNKGVLTPFLFRRFKGADLVTIPRYDKLYIEPDIIGIINFGDKKLWLISECKVDVQWGDYRQALDYANRSIAYSAYIIYCGKVSDIVKKDILKGGHIYDGMNSKGKDVKRVVKIVKAEKYNDKFVFRKLAIPN